MREYLFEVLEGGGDLSMQTVFIRLVMAVVIAAFIYLSYRLSHNGSIYSQKFNVSLAVMTIVTATVMIVIGNNIALSLGMVGALSIVRFRTAIKDSRDTVYIFWAIVVGICCGAGDYAVGALGSAFIFVVLLVLGQFGSVGLAGNSYPGPLYLLAASLAGWMLVYEGAHLLARVPAVSGAFSALGRATMPIVILHFLAFKPVTWLGLLATGGESYLLAAFPIYFTGGAWWVAYTAAGLALPLLAYVVWVRLKKAVRRG